MGVRWADRLVDAAIRRPSERGPHGKASETLVPEQSERASGFRLALEDVNGDAPKIGASVGWPHCHPPCTMHENLASTPEIVELTITEHRSYREETRAKNRAAASGSNGM